ncbi:FAD-dependent oxidoreductase [Paraglaciecola sp. 20A4]|uniref:NAD(P)/FAD-dependent oxidoreductase n=1 Tax=Paraglaciecola sp. 20A4 TaxID=2687288 RepID=UPI0014091A8E|nr:FAD-dependent oxidoreductase [Paraglaciecola sp. 20A4]
MTCTNNTQDTCIIVGASHGGVNLAFALRKDGYTGKIKLVDADSNLPYHRPPLSKTHLVSEQPAGQLLKPIEGYEKAQIELTLGVSVIDVNRQYKKITLSDGSVQSYTNLVLATGATPIIPPIAGLKEAKNVFTIRTADDAKAITTAFNACEFKRVVVIGGGYVGLETAASLRKCGAKVTVLERESRLLARVTAPYMSDYFYGLHQENGVSVFNDKNVSEIRTSDNENSVVCSDGSEYLADIIIVGVGVRVNTVLAEQADLIIENGIVVNEYNQTCDKNIFAIGDCCAQFNPHYQRWIRLESVQNAVDQAKVAAAVICEKPPKYNPVPWFWSDQYAVKLQMVGLSQGYDNIITRKESDKPGSFSVWYFKGEELLAVDAVNHAKAYVLGTKFINSHVEMNKHKLMDNTVSLTADIVKKIA